MKERTARLIDTITPREAVLLNHASTEAILICVLGLFAALFVNASAAAQSAQAGGSQQPQLMDRDKEIALALSACPATVASKAAVYVLEKTGYVKVKDSENGFTAIVQHVRPTSQEPQCLDAEAARVFLPRILKVAELRAQGKTQQEIQAFLSEAVAKGTFSTPTQPGIIYMLSDQNFNTNGKGEVFPPHAMFYGTPDQCGSWRRQQRSWARWKPKGPDLRCGRWFSVRLHYRSGQYARRKGRRARVN